MSLRSCLALALVVGLSVIPGLPPAHGAGSTSTHTVSSFAGGPTESNGHDSGISLGAQDSVNVTATGTVDCNNGGGLCTFGPDGNTSAAPAPGTFIAPGLTPFALLARIGTSGAWTVVGAGPTSITATSSGRLYFAYNDDIFGDNVGNFTVEVTIYRYVPPMIPNGPAVLSGDLKPGSTLTCTSPTFSTPATSVSFQWFIDGVAFGASTVATQPWESTFVLPVAAKVGSTVTCRVMGASDGATSTLAVEAQVPAPPVTTPPPAPTAPTAPTAPACSLDALNLKTLAFGVSSARLATTARRAVNAIPASSCTGRFTVTGHVQPTSNRANDASLSAARANAVTRVLRAKFPAATFTVISAGRVVAPDCKAAQNRCAVIRQR
jgi:outer membrane protein OmpA-like peptidoglycan-associated protein